MNAKLLLTLFFRNGSVLLQIDVDHENGGMKLNEDFLVNYLLLLISHDMAIETKDKCHK